MMKLAFLSRQESIRQAKPNMARRSEPSMGVDRSNQKIKNMTEAQYAEVEELSVEVLSVLAKAVETGDPAGELAQKAADLHKKWLSFYSDSYSKEAHAGIAQMYVDDERFAAYYDEKQPGAARFLRDAILIYTGMKV